MASLQDSIIENLIVQGSAFGGGINPIGTIIAYAGKKTPPNWLFCDGSTFSQTEYPELYDVLETNILPKLDDNRFLEGDDEPKITRVPGLPAITGQYTTCSETDDVSSPSGAFYNVNMSSKGMNTQGDYDNPRMGFDAGRCSSIYGASTTVQPKSYSVRYLIRAK